MDDNDQWFNDQDSNDTEIIILMLVLFLYVGIKIITLFCIS